jgi:hypothetical protein
MTLVCTDRTTDPPGHRRLTIPATTLDIASVLEDQADPMTFRDIKGTLSPPTEPQHRWIAPTLYTAGSLALAGLLVGLMWHVRQRRAERATAWALRQLQALRGEDLIARGDVETFYQRLSDIVRQYVQRRFALPASRQTTDEFLRELAERPILGPEQKTRLGEFLAAADLVKFARFAPHGEQMDDALAMADAFVRETARPVKVTAERMSA